MISPPTIIAIAGIVIAALIGVVIYISSLLHQQQRTSRALSAQKKVLIDQSKQDDETKQILTENKNWFELLFNTTEDMVFVFSVKNDGMPDTFLEANDQACLKLGYTRKYLLEKTIMDIQEADVPVMISGYSRSDLAVLSDSRVQSRTQRIATNVIRKLVERIMAQKTLLYESTFEDRNGEKIPVEVHASVFVVSGQAMIMTAAADITARREAARALHESRLSFRDFLANSPIGIAMYDADKKLVDVNLACLKMFGIPDREQFSRFDLFNNPFIPPQDRARLGRGESTSYEAIIDFGEAIEKSVFISRKTGTAYYDIQINNMGPGEDFRPRGYFAQVQDISERRKAENELKQSEEQLRQAEKMEAVGSMAGGIAHDFNNILTPIIGYSQMLQSKFADDPAAGKFSNGILKAANRAKDLVAQILTFSRKGDAQDDQGYHAIHVIPIVKEVLVLQRTALPKNVEIDRVIKTEHDTVIADPTKVHQVLMNLCTNAGHAMRDTGGGILDVRITEFVMTGRSKGEMREMDPGRYLRISVKDTGSGMEKNVMDRIFEPFFTTKGKGEGTGMGLSVVHGIVRSFKGTITVESEPGKGSVFHVILPIIDSQVNEETLPKEGDLPSGSERILIVDDDRDVCDMTSDMLESLGYGTATANHANGALRLFSIDQNQFDLVITDEVMPGMSGSELAIKLLELRSDLPIILCTGYSNTVTEEHAKEIGVRQFMTKPLHMEELAASVRKLLDEKQSL